MSVVTDRAEHSKGKRQTRIETAINLSPERDEDCRPARRGEKKRKMFDMRTKEEDGICMQAACCSPLHRRRRGEEGKILLSHLFMWVCFAHVRVYSNLSKCNHAWTDVLTPYDAT